MSRSANDQVKFLIGDQAMGLAMLREQLEVTQEKLAEAKKRVAELEKEKVDAALPTPSSDQSPV